MKNKIIFCICFIFCMLFIPVFADDYLYFGGNYSNTLANGNISHGGGFYISSIGMYNKFNIYASLGVSFGICDNNYLDANTLKKLGVKDFDSNNISIPMRIGFPCVLGINEKTKFLFIPSLAFDLNFYKAKFSQEITGYKVNYDISGFGYLMGTAIDIGFQHQLNKVYLRYGVDFDTRLFALMSADIKYSGFISGSIFDGTLNTLADYFMLTTSPYICIGFKVENKNKKNIPR